MTPLSGSQSQIYKRDEVHPPPIRFAIFLLYDNRTGWLFTTYKPDGTPHSVHPVDSLWTRRQAIRFSNFKKWEPDSLIRVSYQKLQTLLNKNEYLGNFFKNSCGIKILYGVEKESTGVQEKFVHFLFWKWFFKNMFRKSFSKT